MNKFKELRKAKNLTQVEFAEKMNVDQSTVSKWEKDKAIPDIQTLYQLANFFNVSVDYILGKDNNPPSSQPEPPQKENTVRIIGRGGVVKEYKVTDRERKLFEAMLEAQDEDPDLKY